MDEVAEELLVAALSYAARRLNVTRLNEKQESAVRGILKRRDVFVNLPTGFGKSVCFQSIPFVMDYITSPKPSESVTDKHLALIVEPTAAIMRDQVTKLQAKGINAAFINHEQSDPSAKQAVVRGQVNFVYISPESLSLARYRDMLSTEPYQENLSVFAVDEAHCVLTWATFRQDFRLLGEVCAVVDCNVIVLTATCTEQAKKEIQTSLCMEGPVVVTHTADRPNIFLQVQPMAKTLAQWLPILQEDAAVLKTLGVAADRKVFFCRTIEMSCKLYEFYIHSLEESVYFHASSPHTASNRLVAMYHSGSAPSVKIAVATSLSDPNGVVRRVFATQSLSMGIDCPNIREVIHWGIPRTLEDYYQECGRAGRDGLPAKATLLYAAPVNTKLCNESMRNYCESTTCYRRVLLTYFNSSVEDLPSLCCGTCLSVSE